MAIGGCTLSSDTMIVKSPNDRRLYRYIQLPNGLCALLVHDPEIYAEGEGEGSKGVAEDDDDDMEDEDDEEEEEDSEMDEDEEDDDDDDEEGDGLNEKEVKGASQKKAAAAMCVGMGSFADPYEAQGLAHFLEHMLFMGSAEFPDENEYDSYLSKHGGSSNAYTETEYTCYHFEVKREFLRGALQRFSQFFIAPLVKAEAMEREVQAVDSEFNQVLQNDACRLQQLQCHTSLTNHPHNRFFWGNKKSLVEAMEKGVDLREQILTLYHENYHGGSMKLVVIGGEMLDVLETWVLELFGNIKKGPQAKPEASLNIPIWESSKLYRLQAVKDVHILDLSWTLPSLRNDYMKKAEDYLAHLLGHEGRGSLLYFLKAGGLVTSISAGVGDDGLQRSSFAYVFGMSIHLTDSGLEKIFEIIGFVYQYIKLLRQNPPQEWIYKELQDIANMDFRFAEEQPQDDYAYELAANLLVYPPQHVVYGDYAYEVWDAQMINQILDYFKPENMRVDVVSKSFDNLGNFVEGMDTRTAADQFRQCSKDTRITSRYGYDMKSAATMKAIEAEQFGTPTKLHQDNTRTQINNQQMQLQDAQFTADKVGLHKLQPHKSDLHMEQDGVVIRKALQTTSWEDQSELEKEQVAGDSQCKEHVRKAYFVQQQCLKAHSYSFIVLGVIFLIFAGIFLHDQSKLRMIFTISLKSDINFFIATIGAA